MKLSVRYKWVLLLALCSIDANALEDRVILQVPFFAMARPNYCGEACLQMIAGYYGKPVSQEYVHDVMAGLAGRDRGIYWTEDLEKTMKKMQILFRGGYRKVSDTADYTDDIQWLVQSVGKGEPVLIGIISLPGVSNKVDVNSEIFNHFVLFVGYDLRKKVIYLHDPGSIPLQEMSFIEFCAHRKNSSNEVYSLNIQGIK